MPIVPDAKNWTWVLERACPECGFDAAAFPGPGVAAALRENARAWREVLASPDQAQLLERPSEERWSAVEYACHVRDVFRLFDARLQLMLTEHDPAFPNWDQDATAVEDRYDRQEPAPVARQLAASAAALADRFDAVSGEGWSRTGTRSDGARFTVDSFSRYLLHDPVHHLDDVRKGLAELASRGT